MIFKKYESQYLGLVAWPKRKPAEGDCDEDGLAAEKREPS
jgi:hypothetical protein